MQERKADAWRSHDLLIARLSDAASLPDACAGPASAAALVAARPRPDAIVIDTVDPARALDWLGELRDDPALALKPVFLERSLGPTVDPLVDGVELALPMLERTATAARELAASLPHEEYPDPEERTLAFLYLRPERRLEPERNWASPRLYHYPLLAPFVPQGMDSLDWVTGLHRRGLLETDALVDRVRLCPGCDHARLSFVDVCPDCSGIDIRESVFLHCYTCGHVAEQDRFLAGGNLSCPKCSARLRHIGVDYDRALESMTCAGCTSRFVDPAVLARCLACGASHGPDDLPERRIHRLRLSADGRHAARTGRLDPLLALTDRFNFSHPAYFQQTLDWLVQLRRRHAEIEFAVACLRFSNLPELLSRLPRLQVMRMLDTLALRLRELVRTTDLIMRSDDRHCWLLLPQTPPPGAAVFLSRVAELSAASRQPDGSVLALDIACRNAGEIDPAIPGAEAVMRELEQGLG